MQFEERDPFLVDFDLSYHRLLINRLDTWMTKLDLANGLLIEQMVNFEERLNKLTQQTVLLTNIMMNKVRWMEVRLKRLEGGETWEVHEILNDPHYVELVKES